MSTPCYNCPNRTIGCHGKCDEYAAYAEERKALYAARLQAFEFNQSIHDLKRRNNRKLNKLEVKA